MVFGHIAGRVTYGYATVKDVLVIIRKTLKIVQEKKKNCRRNLENAFFST